VPAFGVWFDGESIMSQPAGPDHDQFGPLSPKVKQQVEALSPEALTQLQLDLLKAKAIGELRLGD
jgi:hypothetical protein